VEPPEPDPIPDEPTETERLEQESGFTEKELDRWFFDNRAEIEEFVMSGGREVPLDYSSGYQYPERSAEGPVTLAQADADDAHSDLWPLWYSADGRRLRFDPDDPFAWVHGDESMEYAFTRLMFDEKIRFRQAYDRVSRPSGAGVTHRPRRLVPIFLGGGFVLLLGVGYVALDQFDDDPPGTVTPLAVEVSDEQSADNEAAEPAEPEPEPEPDGAEPESEPESEPDAGALAPSQPNTATALGIVSPDEPGDWLERFGMFEPMIAGPDTLDVIKVTTVVDQTAQETLIDICFAGDAQSSGFGGGIVYLPPGDGPVIDLVVRPDGTSKLSDPPPGFSAVTEYLGPNWWRARIPGLVPQDGGTVNVNVLIAANDGYSADTNKTEWNSAAGDSVADIALFATCP
jgi:hypothetical protein